MADITAITGVLTGIKTATEIAKLLKDADVSLEKAELKLKIAKLISALADAKINLSEIQSLIQEKENEISELNKTLELRKKLIRFEGEYFEMDENGKPIGEPYCSHCFEVKGIAVHVIQNSRLRKESVCPSCKNTVRWRSAIKQ